jgi:hypothetical protein
LKTGIARGKPGDTPRSQFCSFISAERIGDTWLLAATVSLKTKLGDRMKGKLVRIVAALGSLTALIVAGSASMKIG